MFGFSNRLAAGAVVALAAIGPLAASLSVADTDRTSSGATGNGLTCEISVSRSGGMVMIEPLVHSGRSVDGMYRLRVTGRGSAGSTDISQGSDFFADPGATTSLGRLSLTSGATYEARLEVEAGRERVSCRETIRR